MTQGASGVSTYFIQAKHGGPVKIGSSRDVRSRLQTLQTGNPFPLVLLATSDRSEKTLHRQFYDLRIQGEWFSADPKLINWIQQHASITPEGHDAFQSPVSLTTPGPENLYDKVYDRDDFTEMLVDDAVVSGLPDTGEHDCGCGWDTDCRCASAEHCECDWCTWMDCIFSLEQCVVVKGVGVIPDIRFMRIACLPLSSHRRCHEFFDTLPDIASEMDRIGWTVHGSVWSNRGVLDVPLWLGREIVVKVFKGDY